MLFQTLRLLTTLVVTIVRADWKNEAKQLSFYKNGKKQLRLEAQDDVYVPQRIESRDDR